MRGVGLVLAGLLLLPVLQSAASVLVAGAILALVLAVVAAPRQTLGVLFCLTLLSAFAAHPLAGLLMMVT